MAGRGHVVGQREQVSREGDVMVLQVKINQYITTKFSKLTDCRVEKSSLSDPALCLDVFHTSIFTDAAATQCETTTLLYNASNITTVCAATVT